MIITVAAVYMADMIIMSIHLNHVVEKHLRSKSVFEISKSVFEISNPVFESAQI